MMFRTVVIIGLLAALSWLVDGDELSEKRADARRVASVARFIHEGENLRDQRISAAVVESTLDAPSTDADQH